MNKKKVVINCLYVAALLATIIWHLAEMKSFENDPEPFIGPGIQVAVFVLTLFSETMAWTSVRYFVLRKPKTVFGIISHVLFLIVSVLVSFVLLDSLDIIDVYGALGKTFRWSDAERRMADDRTIIALLATFAYWLFYYAVHLCKELNRLTVLIEQEEKAERERDFAKKSE
ncbi:MAG: hypothetical protein IKX54_05610 [Lachnospiraceae bacterium]|nr:hypothetical protein [Lachnospiraceae bacterium]